MLNRFLLLTLCLVIVSPVSAELGTPKKAADVGMTVLVPDTILFKVNRPNSNNWEPYASVMGDGTFLIVANSFAADDIEVGEANSSERAVIALIGRDGKVQEFAGFYDDSGQPWLQNMDTVRKDGNPPRIAGDMRPGAVRFMVANETTAWQYPEFAQFGTSPFAYDHDAATVQIFEKTATGIKPVSKAMDPIHGKIEGTQGGQPVRFGGDVVCLSDGNFLVVVEDRTKAYHTEDRAPMAAIVSPTGEIVKAPFNTDPNEARTEIWSNVAAFKGGFAVRLAGVIYFYDNAGNLKGSFNQDETDVTDKGRGDNTRIGSNINSNYVYLIGNDAGVGAGDTWLAKIDATTFQRADQRQVNEWTGAGDDYDYFPKSDRHNLAVDANDNVFCTFEDDIGTGKLQTVGRLIGKDFKPLTPSFLVFSSSESDATVPGVVRAFRVSPAMDEYRIMVAGKGEIPQADGSLTLEQTTIAVVLKHPNAPTPVNEWPLF